jgi:hypothetical protein
MKKIVVLIAAYTALVSIAGCGSNSGSPASGPSNTTKPGVSPDLIGTWKYYNIPLDSVVDGLDFVFTSNNITLDGTSIVATGAQALAKDGNIGYVASSFTGYIYDYSLSANKDSLYVVGDPNASAAPVTREMGLTGAGVWFKQ